MILLKEAIILLAAEIRQIFFHNFSELTKYNSMKIKTGAWFFLPFFVSIALLSCRTFKDPVYKSTDVLKVKKLDAKESVLVVQLNYYNPNKWGLKLKKAEGNAWLNGGFLGHFKMDTVIHISANSDFSIPVNLTITLKDVYTNAVNAILNPEVTIKVEGNARFGKGGVFIHYPIRYEEKIPIDELMK